MKHTKRALALLLSLSLVFGLALPALAEEETASAMPVPAEEEEEPEEPGELPQSTVNWDEFIITKQPQHQEIRSKAKFTLEVEVNIPEGVEVEYQWYCQSSNISGATGPVLQVNRNDAVYPSNYTNDCAYYSCRITGIEKKDGIEVSREWQNSASAVVDMKTMKKTMGKFGERLAETFLVAMLGAYFTPALLPDGLEILSFFIIPFMPFLFILYFFGFLLFPNSGSLTF